MIHIDASKLDVYVDQMVGSISFDLFIGSVSFERRCLGAARVMKKSGVLPKHACFVDYYYALPITSSRNAEIIKKTREKRIQLQRSNRQSLRELLPNDLDLPSVRIENPTVDYTKAIEDLFVPRGDHIREAQSICIDISTFTKPMIFLLTKMLIDGFGKKQFFVVNTIPSRYTPSSLSFNIWGAEIMPAFNGLWDSRKRNVLIVVLGFEGHKFSSILQKWSFSEIIPIVGFPAFHPGLQDRTLVANAETLKRADALPNLRYSPSLDPSESYKTMAEVLDCYYGNYNVAIAPLGPKPMALASALLSVEKSLRVLYAFPQEYSPSYSEEIGESFLYEVRLQ